jgi:hypothetical protein
MVRRPTSLTTFVLLAVFPLGIQFGDEDSTSTTLGVSGGGGNYVALLRSCEDEVIRKDEREFAEGDVWVAYQKHYHGRRAIRLHFSGGAANFSGADSLFTGRSSEDFWYFRPGVRFDFSHIGFGIGLLHTSEPIPTGQDDLAADDDGFPETLPTGTIWIGSLRTIYVDASFYQEGPLLSTGALTIGLGARLGQRVDAWGGVSAFGPYSDGGVLLRTNLQMTKRIGLGVQARLGQSDGSDENSFNVGISYRVQ